MYNKTKSIYSGDSASAMALTLASLPYLERRKKLESPPNNYPRFIYKYLGPDIKDEWLRDYLKIGK